MSGKVDRLGEILTGDHGVLMQIAALPTDTVAHFAAAKADTVAQFLALRADTAAQTAAMKADSAAQMAIMKTDSFARMVDLKSENKTTRWTVVVTVITSVLAAAALVMSVQANLLSAFQAGQPQSVSSSPR